MLRRKWIVMVICIVLILTFMTGLVSADTRRCETVKGTPVIDGVIDSAWANAKYAGEFSYQEGPATAKVRTLWDDDYFYVLFEVKDSVIGVSSSNMHEQDSVEIFFDPLNSKSPTYPTPLDLVCQYRINANNIQSGGGKYSDYPAKSATAMTNDGYIVEVAIPWSDKTNAKSGGVIAVDFQINDDGDQSGTRTGQATWNDTTNEGWRKADVFGEAVLLGTSSGGSSPATGDYTNILLYSVLGLLAGGTLFIRIRKIIPAEK